MGAPVLVGVRIVFCRGPGFSIFGVGGLNIDGGAFLVAADPIYPKSPEFDTG